MTIYALLCGGKVVEDEIGGVDLDRFFGVRKEMPFRLAHHGYNSFRDGKVPQNLESAAVTPAAAYALDRPCPAHSIL